MLGADAVVRARQRRRQEAIARGESDPCGGDSFLARTERAPIRGQRNGRRCRPDKAEKTCRPARPYVWSHSPIDPGNGLGSPPHPVWGTLWQYTWQDFPDDFSMKVERVPRECSGMAKGRARRMWGRRAREFEGSEEYRALGFAGWDFICPGRLNAQIERVPCGRRCRELFLPQPVWTLAMAMGLGLGGAGGLAQSDGESDGEMNGEVGGEPWLVDGEPWRGFEMPRDSGLAGGWYPGVSDPVGGSGSGSGGGGGGGGVWGECAGGPRSFACVECWGVRATCMANKNGWNDFVTHISGGLLYGSDVPRTAAVSAIVRKRRMYRNKKYWRGLGGLEAVARAAVKAEAARAG